MSVDNSPSKPLGNLPEDSDSTVLIDDADVQQAEQEHEKAQEQLKIKKQQTAIIPRVSLFAVRLSGKVAQRLLSGVATAGLMATVAPESVVRATVLVADMQTSATCLLTRSLLVHIPSDSVTIKLVQRLLACYAAINPGCLAAVGKMSPGAAAATTALGGALPMLVAAALQESIEVSRLVCGASTGEQFALASAFLSAQLAGGVAGLAAGAAIGTVIMPGLGTGIGSVAGSYVGSLLAPMLVPVASSSSSSAAPALTRRSTEESAEAAASKNNPPTTTNNVAEQDAELPHSAFRRDPTSGSVTKFSFFFDSEVTSDGFVLVNPACLLEGEESASDDDEPAKRQITPEQQREEFETLSRAVLHRAQVVPLSSVVNSDAAASALVALEHLPGTVLLLQPSSTTPHSAAASASASFAAQRQPSSRIFFCDAANDREANHEQPSATPAAEPQLRAAIRGKTWASVSGQKKS